MRLQVSLCSGLGLPLRDIFSEMSWDHFRRLIYLCPFKTNLFCPGILCELLLQCKPDCNCDYLVERSSLSCSLDKSWCLRTNFSPKWACVRSRNLSAVGTGAVSSVVQSRRQPSWEQNWWQIRRQMSSCERVWWGPLVIQLFAAWRLKAWYLRHSYVDYVVTSEPTAIGRNYGNKWWARRRYDFRRTCNAHLLLHRENLTANYSIISLIIYLWIAY